MLPEIERLLDRLSKIKPLPWKGLLIILSCTFVLTSAISSFLGYKLLPGVSKLAKDDPLGSINIENEASSLNKSQLTSILERNIFNKEGTYPDEEKGTKKTHATDEIIKSTLPLRLIGTIYGGDPKSGLTVIEDTGTRSQNSFMVGDVVMRGATVFEIHKQKVILSVENHKEYIEIVDRQIVRDKRVKKKSTKSSEPSAAKTGDEFLEEGFERKGNSISMSSEYRSKLLSGDFAKVLQDAKADPFYEGSELSGFKLSKIRGDSIYEKAGLQNNDIVKEINGVSLVDTAQAIKLLNQLRGENDIEIRIVRGGKALTINMQVR